MGSLSRILKLSLVAMLAKSPVYTTNAFADDDKDRGARDGDRFRIKSASCDELKRTLKVEGDGERYKYVTVSNADTGASIDKTRVTKSEWKSHTKMDTPPCRVRAQQSNGEVAEKNVHNAPADCAPQPTVGDGSTDPVSPLSASVLPRPPAATRRHSAFLPTLNARSIPLPRMGARTARCRSS